MRRLRLGPVLATAALVAAVAGVGVPAAVAAPVAPAADCSSSGAIVVVDFNELGGGSQAVCRPDGGGQKASTLFTQSGFPLRYASRQPGFVCRVSGLPTSDPCVNTAPADAYWGLWWSDGRSGDWTYSSLGAASLTIPERGYVAFAWDQREGEVRPGFDPVPRQAPAPTRPPSQQPTPQPGSGSGNGAGNGEGNGSGGSGQQSGTGGGQGSTPVEPSASAVPSPSASLRVPAESNVPSPSGGPTRKPSRKPSGEPSASPTEPAPSTSAAVPSDLPTVADLDAAPTSAEPEAADDGLPSYVAPALIVVLFAVAGAVFLLRRRPRTP